jgi:hypothetical protein
MDYTGNLHNAGDRADGFTHRHPFLAAPRDGRPDVRERQAHPCLLRKSGERSFARSPLRSYLYCVTAAGDAGSPEGRSANACSVFTS